MMAASPWRTHAALLAPEDDDYDSWADEQSIEGAHKQPQSQATPTPPTPLELDRGLAELRARVAATPPPPGGESPSGLELYAAALEVRRGGRKTEMAKAKQKAARLADPEAVAALVRSAEAGAAVAAAPGSSFSVEGQPVISMATAVHEGARGRRGRRLTEYVAPPSAPLVASPAAAAAVAEGGSLAERLAAARAVATIETGAGRAGMGTGYTLPASPARRRVRFAGVAARDQSTAEAGSDAHAAETVQETAAAEALEPLLATPMPHEARELPEPETEAVTPSLLQTPMPQAAAHVPAPAVESLSVMSAESLAGVSPDMDARFFWAEHGGADGGVDCGADGGADGNAADARDGAIMRLQPQEEVPAVEVVETCARPMRCDGGSVGSDIQNEDDGSEGDPYGELPDEQLSVADSFVARMEAEAARSAARAELRSAARAREVDAAHPFTPQLGGTGAARRIERRGETLKSPAHERLFALSQEIAPKVRAVSPAVHAAATGSSAAPAAERLYAEAGTRAARRREDQRRADRDASARAAPCTVGPRSTALAKRRLQQELGAIFRLLCAQALPDEVPLADRAAVRAALYALGIFSTAEESDPFSTTKFARARTMRGNRALPPRPRAERRRAAQEEALLARLWTLLCPDEADPDADLFEGVDADLDAQGIDEATFVHFFTLMLWSIPEDWAAARRAACAELARAEDTTAQVAATEEATDGDFLDAEEERLAAQLRLLALEFQRRSPAGAVCGAAGGGDAGGRLARARALIEERRAAILARGTQSKSHSSGASPGNPNANCGRVAGERTERMYRWAAERERRAAEARREAAAREAAAHPFRPTINNPKRQKKMSSNLNVLRSPATSLERARRCEAAEAEAAARELAECTFTPRVNARVPRYVAEAARARKEAAEELDGYATPSPSPARWATPRPRSREVPQPRWNSSVKYRLD